MLLTLENSIKSRHLRITDRISEILNNKNINKLDEREIMIIQYLLMKSRITLKEAKEIIKKGETVSRKLLRELENKNILEWCGSSKNDPTQYYILKV